MKLIFRSDQGSRSQVDAVHCQCNGIGKKESGWIFIEFPKDFGANCLLVQQRLLPSTLDMQQLLTKVFSFLKREKVQPFAELGCSMLIFVEIAKNISGDKGTIIAAFYGCSRSLQLQAMQHCPLNGPRSTNGQNTVLNMRTGRTAAARNSK